MKRRQCKIAAWGELLWDVFHHRDASGQLIGQSAHLGGSAANLAFHASRLGAESTLVSGVGRDQLGRDAVRRIAEAGIRTDGISTDSRCPTGTVQVEFMASQPQFTIAERVAWDHITPSAATLTRVESSDVLCIGTLAQRTPLAQTRLLGVLRKLESAVGTARRPLLFVDLNLRPPFVDSTTILETLRYADLVKVNESELLWIAKVFDTKNPIRFLQRVGRPRVLAITRGGRGATLHGSHVELSEQGRRATGGDPVGAGDSFLACLATSIADGATLPRALERANRYAGWVASQQGAMPRSRPYFRLAP